MLPKPTARKTDAERSITHDRPEPTTLSPNERLILPKMKEKSIERVREYQIDEKYRQEDLRRIKMLREFYRRKFRAGDSDEAFLIWIKTCLEELKEKS